MIALRSNLPLVRFPDGRVMNFERPWLAASVARAAASAGYKKWWLASHVTESVTSYFEQDYGENAVTISSVEKAVQSVLQVIGYADVATHFRALPPPARISLWELARDAGCGYELAFFDLLRARVREVLEAKVERLEICDAFHGVKLLRAAKVWRRDCAGLLEDIVHFVRVELDGSRRELQVQLS